MVANVDTDTRLALRETDEADNLTATYIFSGQDTPKSASSAGGRVDILVRTVSYSFSVRISDTQPSDIQADSV